MAAPKLDHTGADVDWDDVIGMDWDDTFTVDDPATGDPFNLTGCTITAKIADAPKATGSVVATVTATIVDAAGGVFRLTIPRATTATIAAGSYYWACAIRNAAGEKVRWMYGRFTVVDGVPTRVASRSRHARCGSGHAEESTSSSVAGSKSQLAPGLSTRSTAAPA